VVSVYSAVRTESLYKTQTLRLQRVKYHPSVANAFGTEENSKRVFWLCVVRALSEIEMSKCEHVRKATNALTCSIQESTKVNMFKKLVVKNINLSHLVEWWVTTLVFSFQLMLYCTALKEVSLQKSLETSSKLCFYIRKISDFIVTSVTQRSKTINS
jgi:hypothetical protein